MSINIDSIKRRLLVKYPMFGGVIANLNYVEWDGCYSNGLPTAATDGKNIYYHPDILNNLSFDELVFTFAHEVCHVAFDHIYRSEGKDTNTWNIATDAVINALLKNDGINPTDASVNMPEAINYNAEDMYEKLLREKEKNNSSDNKKSDNNTESDNSNKNENSNVSRNDSHGMWQDAVAKMKQEENEKSNNDLNSSDNIEENSKNDNSFKDDKTKNKGFLDKFFRKKKKQDKKEDTVSSTKKDDKQTQEEKINEYINKLAKLGEKEIFKQNKITREERLEELKEGLAKQSAGFGSETGKNIRVVDNIGFSDALIDWRKLLKEAVKFDVDWSYQNASIEDGVVTPYLEELPKPETEIVLDTSGSVDEVLLKNFLRECKNIFLHSKVKVGCFDTEFYGFNEIKSINDIDNMNFVGGGGTSFDVAVNAFSKRVENKIIFTDGEGVIPDEKMDIIWVVFGGRKISPNGGKVINIDQEQLEKLSSYNNEYSIKTR